jgi:hypothetical protein
MMSALPYRLFVCNIQLKKGYPSVMGMSKHASIKHQGTQTTRACQGIPSLFQGNVKVRGMDVFSFGLCPHKKDTHALQEP